MTTSDDLVLLEEIRRCINAADDVGVAQHIDRFYRDLDRADRAPRQMMYWHIGLLVGIVLRLLDAPRTADHTLKSGVVDPMSAEVRYFRWTTAQRAALLAQVPIQLQVCDVRPHLHRGLIRYVVDGVLPGGFLQACLCVHLIEVARRGDGVSLLSLPGVVTFLEHYAPADCWGSRAKVLAWTTTPDRLEIPE